MRVAVPRRRSPARLLAARRRTSSSCRSWGAIGFTSVVAADLNGDGEPDLAAGAAFPSDFNERVFDKIALFFGGK